jgi:hypothetical protein
MNNLSRDDLVAILCMKLATPIVDGFTSMLEEAMKRPRPVDSLKLYLKDIQNWDDDILTNETKRIELAIPSIRQLIKAIITKSIQMVSSMKQHTIEVNDAYITSKTPALKSFIHQLYLYSAKEFFYYPEMITSTFATHRRQQLKIIEHSIKVVLNDYIPLSDLLSSININDETTIQNDTLTIPIDHSVKSNESDNGSEFGSESELEEDSEEEEDESKEESTVVKKKFF